jgi:hypothetical protein
MLTVQSILAHGGAQHRETTRWDNTRSNRSVQTGRSFQVPAAKRMEDPEFLCNPLPCNFRSSYEQFSLLAGFGPFCG